jgi:hypothetical protein
LYPLLQVWFSDCAGALVHKGTQPSDGFAQNEVLHLRRAFITDKCFSVREESPDVVIYRKAIASENLPGPCHSLATLGRGKRLGESCLSVRQLALVVLTFTFTSFTAAVDILVLAYLV